MELVAVYKAVINEQAVEAKGVPYNPGAMVYQNIDEGWDAFHASSDRTLAVYAGRRTGKTYNIAKLAIETDQPVQILVMNQHSIEFVFNEIINQLQAIEDRPQYTSGRSRTQATIYLQGREIKINYLPREGVRGYRGRRFFGITIFDEFDSPEFGMNLEDIEPCLAVSDRVIGVSSYKPNGGLSPKLFFYNADNKMFIDNTDITQMMFEDSQYEATPSIMNEAVYEAVRRSRS